MDRWTHRWTDGHMDGQMDTVVKNDFLIINIFLWDFLNIFFARALGI